MNEPNKHYPVFLGDIVPGIVVTAFRARIENSDMFGYVVPNDEGSKMPFYHYRYVREDDWRRSVLFVHSDDIVYSEYVDAVEEFE